MPLPTFFPSLAFDIGGTSVKCLLFLEQNVPTRSWRFPSSTLLHSDIVSHLHAHALPYLSRIRCIAISICGAPKKNQYHGWFERFGVPTTLPDELSRLTKLPVWLFGDAESWAAHLKEKFAHLIKDQASLALAFGTGIASAVIFPQKTVACWDLAADPALRFKSLQQSCNALDGVSQNISNIHDLFGAVGYAALIASQPDPAILADLVTRRWGILIRTLQQVLAEQNQVIHSVLLGGGLANTARLPLLTEALSLPIGITENAFGAAAGAASLAAQKEASGAD